MERFSNLPTPIKWVLGVTGIGAVLGTVLAFGGGRLLLTFVLIVAGLLLVLLGGYFLWEYLKRRKQNARLGSEINRSTTAAPRGMSATDLAKLDNLRKKFQEGIEAFRSRGKDLYALPWYVIVGEPGSGKTEAIRHCNVGFPPGMHEGDDSVGYLGAGGTINMNWWFTNYAVMLDTAGRLMFEEVKPGETSEWREFLKLLKKNRPNCPINGLLLVIPSDSLIKDTAEQIAAKAGKIAQQLDVIQRVLDFRFPVYVVVTKSDKINGFREFFENVTDPQLQHQMLGWSNPNPLDAPFKPEQIDQHLGQVAERLRRRRLGLMRDPVPENAPRRTDEVDSLYALPNSLLMLTPRLRRYLETIFMPGEWSAKPLFLRGIYFTSSMREGAALDQELAEAIGVQPDELPEGKIWERDRAYFLRDLFIEKVFREKGLVTRASNVGARLRRNHLITYSCTFVALVIFVIVGWLGMKTVRAQVKDRSDIWAAAANSGWDEDQGWHYRVLRLNEDTGKYFLYTNAIQFAGENLTPGQIQQKIRELALRELKGRWTSPGLAHSYNANSKRAQRVIFETSVLQPAVDVVNRRMRSATPDQPQPYLLGALATLVRLESDIVKRERGVDVPMDPQVAADVLGPLLSYATDGDVAVDTNLIAVMVWTYTDNSAGQRAWPPGWLSSTTNSAGTLTNPVITAGFNSFLSGSLGFPLLRNSSKFMSPGEVRRAGSALQQMLADGTLAAIQALHLRPTANWATFTNRLFSLKQMTDALGANGQPEVCTISLLKMEDQSRADDAWRTKYRYIKIAGDANKMENTNIGEDAVLGKVNITDGCSFQLYQRDTDKTPGETTADPGQWGPLALIAKYDGRPAEGGDYSTWIVKRPVSTGTGFLRIKLKFDEPLVSMEHWPKE